MPIVIPKQLQKLKKIEKKGVERRLSRVVFSSLKQDWKTPKAFYEGLNAEFHFDFDKKWENLPERDLNIYRPLKKATPSDSEFLFQSRLFLDDWLIRLVFLSL